MRKLNISKLISWLALLAFAVAFTLAPILSTVGTLFGVPIAEFAGEIKLANQQLLREIGAPPGVAPAGSAEELAEIDGARILVARVQAYQAPQPFAEVVAGYEAILAPLGWTLRERREGRAEFCLAPRTLSLEPAAAPAGQSPEAAGGFRLRLEWLSGQERPACR